MNMTKINVPRHSNFTIMSNHHLQERGLSLKAKGLMSQILSLPPEWDMTIAGLVQINQEKECAITAALKELKDFGYITVDKRYPGETESGRIEYEYTVHEIPDVVKVQEKQEVEIQGVEKQGVDFLGVEIQGVEIQDLENQGQLNTYNKELSIKDKELRTKDKDKGKNPDAAKKSMPGAKRFIPPTLEEVEEYCKKRNSPVDPKQFYEYFTVGKWIDSKGEPVKNWKQKLLTWEQYRNGGARGATPNKRFECKHEDGEEDIRPW